MTSLTAFGLAVLRFLSEALRSIPLLGIWIAKQQGVKQGHLEEQAAQNDLNQEVKEAYQDIDAKASNDGDWIK